MDIWFFSLFSFAYNEFDNIDSLGLDTCKWSVWSQNFHWNTNTHKHQYYSHSEEAEKWIFVYNIPLMQWQCSASAADTILSNNYGDS